MQRPTEQEPDGTQRCELSRVGLTVVAIGVLHLCTGVFRMLPAYHAWTEGLPTRSLFSGRLTLILGILFLVTGGVCLLLHRANSRD